MVHPRSGGKKSNEDLLGSEHCWTVVKEIILSNDLQATSSGFINLDQSTLRYKGLVWAIDY